MQSDQIKIGDHIFNTLIAVTPDEHMKGLMYQKWPPPAMCFPYKKAEPRKFWMKNTICPLDIIFCNNNKVVDICYGEPMSTRLIGPNLPSDLVIELPHGTVKERGISIGDKISLNMTERTIARDIRDIFERIR